MYMKHKHEAMHQRLLAWCPAGRFGCSVGRQTVLLAGSLLRVCVYVKRSKPVVGWSNERR